MRMRSQEGTAASHGRRSFSHRPCAGCATLGRPALSAPVGEDVGGALTCISPPRCGQGTAGKGTREHPGAQGRWLLVLSPHWEGPGVRRGHSRRSAHAPDTGSRRPKDGAEENPSPVVSSALRLPRRGRCFSQGFHSPHPTPTHRNLQPLAPGTGPAHPARGGCCQGSLPTLTSSLGQETPA